MDKIKCVHELKARDIMSDDIVMLESNSSVEEAAQILRKNRITGAPVTDEDGGLVGVLSLADIYAYETGTEIGHKRREGYYHESDLVPTEETAARCGVPKSLKDVTVEEIMSTKVVSAVSNAPIPQIASILIEKKVRRVLLIDNQRLVGIVTRTDVLKAVAHEIALLRPPGVPAP